MELKGSAIVVVVIICVSIDLARRDIIISLRDRLREGEVEAVPAVSSAAWCVGNAARVFEDCWSQYV